MVPGTEAARAKQTSTSNIAHDFLAVNTSFLTKKEFFKSVKNFDISMRALRERAKRTSTSYIAHDTLAVHTFLTKKEFFKSVQNFSLLVSTHTQTDTQTDTQTTLIINR